MALTKQQAATLFAYGYKLLENEPSLTLKKLTITSVGDGWFTVKRGECNFTVYFKDVGEYYKILCRPLSQLTEEIEHEGKKFVPEDKIKCNNILYCNSEYSDILQNIAIIAYNSYESTGFDEINSTIEQLYAWHFNLNFPKNTVKYIK